MPEKFEPTEEQRRVVRTMGGMGATREDIATVLGINVKTVSRHFIKELRAGDVEANMAVARSLYQMAVGKEPILDPEGKSVVVPGRDPIVAAAIFWLKTRAKWTYPKQEVEVKATISEELADLSEDELIARYQKAHARIVELAARSGLDRAGDSGQEGEESTRPISSLH